MVHNSKDNFFASQPCSENRTRERVAYPVRRPGKEKTCPPTTESEPCQLNRNCFHYSYNITGWCHPALWTQRGWSCINLLLPADWSTCQLSDRAVCGHGIKTRMLDCVRSDGKSVDLSFCKQVRCLLLLCTVVASPVDRMCSLNNLDVDRNHFISTSA